MLNNWDTSERVGRQMCNRSESGPYGGKRHVYDTHSQYSNPVYRQSEPASDVTRDGLSVVSSRL